MTTISPIQTADLESNLDHTEIYKQSLYLPAELSSQDLTFEILNGGMHINSYIGKNNKTARSITPEKVQMGSFAQGYYFGFDRNHFIMAEQQSPLGITVSGSGTVMQKRILHSSLCADVFFPFQPSLVLFGFQALFCQEASRWATGVESLRNVEDFFDVTMKAGMIDSGTVSNLLPNATYYHKLPTTRYVNGPGGRTGTSKTNSRVALPDEDSWRFVSRQGQVAGTICKPGYFTCRVSIGALSHNDDIKKQKLHTPTGGVWILALR